MAIINWTDRVVELREAKKIELNMACNQTILGRFSASINGVTYYFSNDSEAQANFEKADNAFYRGRMTEITWTAYDVDGNVVRIALDEQTFETVYMSHLYHIQLNISKFRDKIMPLLEKAKSEPEINAISWDMDLSQI